MASVSDQATVKSKKPSDSAFKQQRLAAWQPILTAGTVLPSFFVIGIAFIPIGIGLLYFSDSVKEFIIDYTECESIEQLNETCEKIIMKDFNATCTCKIPFNLPEKFEGEVFMYYGLTNFYQNHRRYVKSRDDNQLLGHLEKEVSSDCAPFHKTGEGNKSMTIAPCGAIANSLFNDTLRLSFMRPHEKSEKEVILIRTGIAWPSDKNIKFQNPNTKGGDLQEEFKGYAKPLNWQKEVWQLDPNNSDNNGFRNEDLIVWMRTAALPTFRKLYRRVDHNHDGFRGGIPDGDYILYVDYRYPVTAFEGTKRMILSTTSLLGGKNPFLGIAYIVVGCVCLLMGIVFLFIHIKCGKSTSDMINITPRTPY